MNLFVYGTLRSSRVQQALTGKSFVSLPARLEGYVVHKLHDRKSPGMVHSEHDIADGRLLLNVDKKSFDTIVAWENTDYHRETVHPLASLKTDAETFIWNGETLDTVWDYAEFLHRDLQWYIDVDIPKFLEQYIAQ